MGREDRQDINKRLAGSDVPKRDERVKGVKLPDHRGEANPRITNSKGYKGSHRDPRDR